ncbi:methylthioribulose 1-phosphate dehydratase [Actinokineospora soli]
MRDALAAGTALAAESARYTGLGWMRGTSGNLSVTLSRDPLRLAVTASGLDKGELAPTDFVVVDADGAADADQPGGPGLLPSAEAGLHAPIAVVAGAGAVVHLHMLAPVVAAELWPSGIVLRDLEMLKGFGRRAEGDEVVIPVVPNSQDMDVLGDDFERVHCPDTPALVVARHGVYVWADDLLTARHRAECLEWLLRFATEVAR